MGHTSTYYNLLDEFKAGSCPVCGLARRAVASWLDSVAYEMVNDMGVRDSLREAAGFCNQHAYEWMDRRALLGTSIVYNDVLTHLTKQLRSMSFHDKRDLLAGVASLLGNGREETGRGLLRHDGMCPVCGTQREAEAEGIQTLLGGLDEPDFREVYSASVGLCLPHLSLALERARSERIFSALIGLTVARHESMCAQLREIIRKHDYRFMDEPAGEEKGAASRAVRHVVGERGVRGLDLREGER